ncbi:M35 family metallo-endopeptidase [Herbaspirillum camelliae]|uniref:M35 family metallo-endopeptidase n=1 Tax=Herbaspirillum camelliae TaxID=1892903 RepID=UPI000B1BE83C|nr:M35 family metallo-endopeptidase [Herbaspirillum camelliae]
MRSHADKQHQSRSEAKEPGESALQFNDRRPETAALKGLQVLADAGPAVSQLRAYQIMADVSPQGAQARTLQGMLDSSTRMADAARFSAMQSAPAQRSEANDDEVRLQAAVTPQAPLQKVEALPRHNNTGLPDNLKSGIESLSGVSMGSVRVHYNSSQPAQLNALGYAQGTDIHVAPGQEKHLPHEAWHVVQQAQGRVKPTTQMKGMAINDDAGLETEADVMGGRAVSVGTMQAKQSMVAAPIDFFTSHGQQTIQRARVKAVGQSKIPTKLNKAFDSAHDYLRRGIEAIDASIERIQQYFHEDNLWDVKPRLEAMLETLTLIKGKPVEVNNELAEDIERELTGYRVLNIDEGDGNAYTQGSGETALITFLPTGLKHSDFNLAMTIIHEIAHATPGVDAEDIAYGQHRFFNFINEFPAMAIKNADSFAFAVAALNGQDLKSSRAADNIEEVPNYFEGSFFTGEEKVVPPIILKVIKTMAFAEQMWNQSAYQLVVAQAELAAVKESKIQLEKTRLYQSLPFRDLTDFDNNEKILNRVQIMGLAVAEITNNVAFYSRQTGVEFVVKKGVKADRLIIGDGFENGPQPRQLFWECSGITKKLDFLYLWEIFVRLSGKSLVVPG